MASAGPNAPGTMADDSAVGTNAWSDPDSAKTDNNQYASVGNSTGTRYSHYLKATNFGFAIPAGSTIDGVAVSIRRFQSSGVWVLYDHVVKLVKGGAVSGDNKAATGTGWTTTETAANYGGAADLWGNTLTPDDVNGSTFGVVLETKSTILSKGSNTASVDYISMTVTYTEGGGGASAVPTIMNQYRQRRA